MPHIRVEYSANISDELDVPVLLRRLRDAVVETGVFPLSGVRIRAFKCEDYVIADGEPDNSFVDVVIWVGPGRDVATRKRAGNAVFDVLCDELAPIEESRPLGLTLYIHEAHPDLSFKKNNLPVYLEKRAKI